MLAVVLAAAVLATGALVTAPAAATTQSGNPAHTGAGQPVLMADLTQFRPGNIISNEVFFDTSTMTAEHIDWFLRQRVPTCRAGYTCLKDFRESTFSRGADRYCNAYSGAANETSAQIIYKVSQACGINPQVLIVTLEKEQGLVTHTWPSDWRYTIAMGQGCPDTAGCDTRYYGFYNQVYGAARQFKIYTEGRYFTYYAPGRTWNLRYHPNTACGSSPVYIENQATANLYYYTPYQPNAAALRAGYGTGDSCSSYGNRNFYQRFTDWFGSTQGKGIVLAKLSGDPAVYLLSGSSRWHVAGGDDFGELNAAFGPAHTVSATFLSNYALVGTTSAVLRDPSTGVMSLIQGGQRHRLPTCEAVAIFGGSCASPTNVSVSLLAKLPQGAEVGSYVRVRGEKTYARVENPTTVTPLYNDAAARAVNGDVRTTPYAPYLAPSRYNALTKRPMLFAPAQLVKSSTDSKVYLTLNFDRLAWVRDWGVVADYNRKAADLAVVAPTDLAAYRTDGDVAPTLSCDGVSYFPAAGWLYRLADPSKVGLSSMTAGADTCRQFSTSGTVISGDLAVVGQSSPDVSIIEEGTRRVALSWQLLVQHNGGSVPPIIRVADTTVNGIAESAPIADGMVVKSPSSPDLKLVSGKSASWITSAGIASDIGLDLRYTLLSDARMSGYQGGPQVGPWLKCADQTYFGASGRLWPLSAFAASASGFTALELSGGACAALKRETAVVSLVAVKVADSPTVYVASGGTLRPVASWSALVAMAGGAPPQILTVTKATLDSMPKGETLS